MIIAEPTTHIRIDKSGVAWIDDTNVKVIEVIQDHLAHGLSPEEIHLQHPHLSLAQVHAAFSFFYDHESELQAEIGRRRRRIEAIQRHTPRFASRKALVARRTKR